MVVPGAWLKAGGQAGLSCAVVRAWPDADDLGGVLGPGGCPLLYSFWLLALALLNHRAGLGHFSGPL